MILLLEFWIGRFRSSSLKVSAVSKKWEPAKVKSLWRFEIFCFLCVIELVVLVSMLIHDVFGFQVVPQADRVLVRLEELSEVSSAQQK